MAARKKAVARRQSGGMSKWQERMAKYKSNFGDRERDPTGNRLSIRGGKFSLGGNNLGDVLDVVVLDYVHVNSYYTTAFDPDNPTPPVCFAIAKEETELAPVDGCSDPQATACDGCWANEFGSANTGKGKACNNRRRISLLRLETVEDAIAGSVELTEEDVAVMEIAGTSLGSWTTYVNKVAKRLGLPPFMVRTQLSFDQSANYPKVDFNILPDQIEYDDATGNAVMDIIDGFEERLLAIPRLTATDTDEDAAPSRAAPQASRKKVSRKKRASRLA